MKRLWHSIAFLLLALMVPASVCCMGAQPVEQHDCKCSSAPEQNHDAPAQPEVCPSYTIAHSQLPSAVVMPDMQMVELVDIIHAWMHLSERTVREAEVVPLPSTPPPELRATWVFVSRAALPARAPSELA